MNSQSKIILSLDTDTVDDALRLARLLRAEVGAFKVGLELVNCVGFDIFEALFEEFGGAARVFYDAKLHDIPNTVRGAARGAARLGIWMLNVHASGGRAMMEAAVQGVCAVHAAGTGGDSPDRPLVMAVTLLTSIDVQTLSHELTVGIPLRSYAAHLARLAQHSGCDGVIASPQEVALIRKECGKDFLIVTPGVRPHDAALNDQKRTLTPAEAIWAGSDYLVIGRPITASSDPVAAARAINRQIAHAQGNPPPVPGVY